MNYTLHRCDRLTKRGGGVLIAIRNHISASQVNVPGNLEMVWLQLHSQCSDILIGVCYRAPDHHASFISELHDSLSSIFNTLKPNASVILFGDFNFPNIDWNSLSSGHQFDNEFIDLALTFNLSQMITKPTRVSHHSSNILDLCLTTDPSHVNNITHLPAISDHNVIHLNLQFDVVIRSCHYKFIKDYNKADYDAINRNLQQFYDTFHINFYQRTVEENWNLFKNKVTTLTDTYVPTIRIKTNNAKPWYNKKISKLSARKKRHFKQAKEKDNALHGVITMHLLRNIKEK